MNRYSPQRTEDQQWAASAIAQQRNGAPSRNELVDSRPDVAQAQQLQYVANNRPEAVQLQEMSNIANSGKVVQLNDEGWGWVPFAAVGAGVAMLLWYKSNNKGGTAPATRAPADSNSHDYDSDSDSDSEDAVISAEEATNRGVVSPAEVQKDAEKLDAEPSGSATEEVAEKPQEEAPKRSGSISMDNEASKKRIAVGGIKVEKEVTENVSVYGKGAGASVDYEVDPQKKSFNVGASAEARQYGAKVKNHEIGISVGMGAGVHSTVDDEGTRRTGIDAGFVHYEYTHDREDSASGSRSDEEGEFYSTHTEEELVEAVQMEEEALELVRDHPTSTPEDIAQAEANLQEAREAQSRK